MNALIAQVVAEATGRTIADLLSGVIKKVQPPLERRRLLPLKHMPQQTGYAASLAYCLQQRPPLLPLTPVPIITDWSCKVACGMNKVLLVMQEVVGLVKDAYQVCDADTTTLIAPLQTQASRQAASEALPAMRIQCLSLVCAALSWPAFRSLASPSPPLPEGQTAPPDTYRLATAPVLPQE